MTTKPPYEVIIIGGSYAGLSAAMTLGRSLRKTLVIDAGQPCNRYTPHSHNLITHDGRSPAEIASIAKDQVLRYDTVSFVNGLAESARKTTLGFEVINANGEVFETSKLVLATGLKDIFPDIDGVEACWGKSIIHCPYCHGYEVRGKRTAIWSNGDKGFHYAKLISHWTNDLTILTDGPATFSQEQMEAISRHPIPIIESPIRGVTHYKGQIQQVQLEDGSTLDIEAIYAGLPFKHSSDIAEQLGCEMNEHGLIKVDPFQKTTVPGVFACGDNAMMRSVAVAISSGVMAGAALNMEMIEEVF